MVVCSGSEPVLFGFGAHKSRILSWNRALWVYHRGAWEPKKRDHAGILALLTAQTPQHYYETLRLSPTVQGLGHIGKWFRLGPTETRSPKPISPEPRHTRDSVLVLVVDRCYKALHALLVGPAGQADISLRPLKAWHVKPFIKPNHDETLYTPNPKP